MLTFSISRYFVISDTAAGRFHVCTKWQSAPRRGEVGYDPQAPCREADEPIIAHTFGSRTEAQERAAAMNAGAHAAA
jgi:hypothetical protein